MNRRVTHGRNVGHSDILWNGFALESRKIVVGWDVFGTERHLGYKLIT